MYIIWVTHYIVRGKCSDICPKINKWTQNQSDRSLLFETRTRIEVMDSNFTIFGTRTTITSSDFDFGNPDQLYTFSFIRVGYLFTI